VPLSDRDYIRGKHPSSCTCDECTLRRLKALRAEREKELTSHHRRPLGIQKLFLSLLVIAGLVDIIRRGYILLTQQTNPMLDTIICLVEVGLWFWVLYILRGRKYRHRQPKFKIVFVAVIAISLVLAFAGLEPLTSYKYKAFTLISKIWE